jgi:hypothetical protein
LVIAYMCDQLRMEHAMKNFGLLSVIMLTLSVSGARGIQSIPSGGDVASTLPTSSDKKSVRKPRPLRIKLEVDDYAAIQTLVNMRHNISEKASKPATSAQALKVQEYTANLLAQEIIEIMVLTEGSYEKQLNTVSEFYFALPEKERNSVASKVARLMYARQKPIQLQNARRVYNHSVFKGLGFEERVKNHLSKQGPLPVWAGAIKPARPQTLRSWEAASVEFFARDLCKYMRAHKDAQLPLSWQDKLNNIAPAALEYLEDLIVYEFADSNNAQKGCWKFEKLLDFLPEQGKGLVRKLSLKAYVKK